MAIAKKNKKGFVINLVEKKLRILNFLSPIGDVLIRVWVALIFWKSGLTKISSMDSTVFLFTEEYKTYEKITLFGHQILTPEFTAYLATFNEIVFSLLLVIGLGSRFAAFALLLMTAVIEFTYQSFPEHALWAVLLISIILRGGGRFSWDYFIKANFLGFSKDSGELDKLFATFGTLCATIYAGYLIFENIIK